MKLNEMTAEKAFEAMGRMIPHVTAILEDPAVADCKKMLKDKKENGAKLFSSVMPLMLVKHSDHIFGVVAAATGTTEADVKKLPMSELKATFEEAWADVLGFFPLCLRLVVNA